MRWQLLALLLIGVLVTSNVTLADDANTEQLTQKLQSKDPAVRIAAAKALGKLENPSKAVLTAMVQAALDKDVSVRRAVRDAIRALKVPSDVFLPIVVKALDEADPSLVVPALQTLAEDGEKALPRIIEALQDDKACYWACLVVGEMGPKAKATVPHLMKVLQHRHPECRMQSLEALGQIGAGAKPAAKAIAEVVANDKNVGVRYSGLYALGKIGDPAALPGVRKLVKSDDPIMQVLAAWAQSRLSKDEEIVNESVALLVRGLTSKNPQVQAIAVEAIAESDLPPEKLSPGLIKALHQGDEEMVQHLIVTMARLGPKVAPRLARGLNNEKLRGYSIRVIQRMGADAKELTPNLIALINDKDVEFRREVLFAIGAIGPHASEAIPSLLKVYDGDDLELKRNACYALGKIGPRAKAALPILQKNLTSEDRFLRTVSAWAMLQIQPENEQIAKLAVPMFVNALKDDRDLVRAEIATALGHIGKTAQPAVPALKALVKSDDSLLVRAAAADAIKQISGEDVE